jgi:predicted dehydrogenase
MSTKKVRWGILGVAKINDRVLPSYRRAANAEVVAIASRSLDRARHAADAAGIPKAYGSYEALLADPDIDVVYNPLPNTLHAEWTRKAADRGKHVLCEKPLTPTAAEAEELVGYCLAKNIKLMDGFMWPHHPRTAAMKRLLLGGAIGTVQKVVSTFTFKMPAVDPKNIRLQPDLAGGSLLDVGCYPVYGIRWAMGAEPVRAWATARYEHGCDVELSGVLWFPDGRTATFDTGFVHPFRQWFEVVGTDGTLTVSDFWLPRAATYEVRANESAVTETHVVPGHDQVTCMVENFSRHVRGEDAPIPPIEEAIKTLGVLDALGRSAREGRAVDV